VPSLSMLFLLNISRSCPWPGQTAVHGMEICFSHVGRVTLRPQIRVLSRARRLDGLWWLGHVWLGSQWAAAHWTWMMTGREEGECRWGEGETPPNGRQCIDLARHLEVIYTPEWMQDVYFSMIQRRDRDAS